MARISLPNEAMMPFLGGTLLAHTMIIDNGKFLLVQRAKDGRSGKAGDWDLPGGKANPGESAQAAAARETLEETGLTVQVREPLTMASSVESKISLTPMITMVFRATLRPAPDSKGDISLSVEHKAYRWVTPKEARGHKTVPYVASAVESAQSQGFL